MSRAISNEGVVLDWLARTTSAERRESMLTWLQCACRDPDLVTHGEFVLQGSRRTTRYARVPHTAATVLFKVFDTPVRVVHLVDIVDDPDDLQEVLDL